MDKKESNILLLSFVVLLLIGFVANLNNFGITGEGILTKKGTLEASPYSPKNAEVIYSKEITLKWNIYSDVTPNVKNYHVIVDDNVAFSSPEDYYGMGDKKEKTIIINEEGRYHWRVRLHDQDGWGKWSEIRSFTVRLTKFSCNDGTEPSKCADTKPWYCDKKDLVQDCNKCGCPFNTICQNDGSCASLETKEVKCADGTNANRCSLSKPKYCRDGELVDNSALCGCPEGMQADEDGERCAVIESPKRTGFLDFLKRFFYLEL